MTSRCRDNTEDPSLAFKLVHADSKACTFFTTLALSRDGPARHHLKQTGDVLLGERTKAGLPAAFLSLRGWSWAPVCIDSSRDLSGNSLSWPIQSLARGITSGLWARLGDW